MGYVKAGNHSIYYEVDGEGPPLLLIMGLGGNMQVWYSIRKQLSSQYKLILYDMRGTGRSSEVKEKATMNDLMEDIDVLLDHLNIEKIYAIGYSFGVAVLLNYANRYPEKIESMSLISGVYEITPYLEKFFEMQELLVTKLNRDEYLMQILPWLLSETFLNTNPEFYDRILLMAQGSWQTERPFQVWRIFADSFEKSYEKYLTNIAVPTQIIHGTEDKVSSLQSVLKQVIEIEDYQVDIVRRGGHMIILDSADEVVVLLQQFLKSKVHLKSEEYQIKQI